jgi:hypothetical protein
VHLMDGGLGEPLDVGAELETVESEEPEAAAA